MNKDLIERGEPYDKKNWYIQRIQYRIIKTLNKSPKLKNIVKNILNYFKILKYQRQLKEFSTNKNYIIDPNKTYWIDPKKIKYASLKEFHVGKYKGKIINGDWDLLKKPFENLDIFIALRERLIEGKEWKTTVFYNRIFNEIKQGKFLWGCKNQFDFENRLKKIEILFENIKKNGYKSQKELQSNNNINPILLEDEVAINIGRNGDFLFNNGAHRLSIAKILNIKKIPIKITVRHPQSTIHINQILSHISTNRTVKIR